VCVYIYHTFLSFNFNVHYNITDFNICLVFNVQYFYDPLGQMYHTRGEVDQIYADIEKSRAIVVFRK